MLFVLSKESWKALSLSLLKRVLRELHLRIKEFVDLKPDSRSSMIFFSFLILPKPLFSAAIIDGSGLNRWASKAILLRMLDMICRSVVIAWISSGASLIDIQNSNKVLMFSDS